jgi:nucleoporin NDC1
LNIGLDPAYNTNATARAQQPAPSVNLVPRIAQSLRDDKQIAAAPPKPNTKWEHIEAAAAGLAKSQSAPGNAQQAYSREAINRGMQKAQEGAREAESFFTKYYSLFVGSQVGALFQQSLQRTSSIVILGAPYSRISLVCNAITALTNLAVFSLSQDTLGRFHEGIPDIIRVFTVALNKIDEYMATVPIHSSDKDTLSKPEADQRKVPEVDEVRECLREGLEKILGGFTEYLSGFAMTRLEILDAKKAVGVKKGPEMIQAAANQ